jgi:hypothetical protein
MSDTLTINIEEVPQVFTLAIQEASDGAPGANGQDGQNGQDGITPQLRATGTALEADSGEGWEELIDLGELEFVSLSGDETIAGNKGFSGQVELLGQTAPNSTSAMSRGLGDARYGRRPIILDQDFSKTSDIVASDVPMASAANHPQGLSVFGFSVAANEAVAFEYILHTTDASSPRNQRYDFGVPSGYASLMLGLSATGNAGTTATYSFGASDAVVNALSSGTNGGIVHIRGVFVNGATAGNVVLRFRQQASSVNTITLKKGSACLVHRS